MRRFHTFVVEGAGFCAPFVADAPSSFGAEDAESADVGFTSPLVVAVVGAGSGGGTEFN